MQPKAIRRANARRRATFLRLAASAAIVLLLFITAVGLCHYHDGSASASDTCQVCHVAHAPVVQTQIVSSIVAPAFIGWTFVEPTQSLALTVVLHEAAPRAPPAA